MGLPELPGQSDNEEFRMEEEHIINLEVTTDDSENESMDENEYMGYQPLNINDENETMIEDGIDLDIQNTTDTSTASEIKSDTELLNLDVWNAPRPDELNIDLDSTKAEEIVSVMAKFKLPNISVPDWATEIPEEQWKADLLHRIRQRQHINTNEIKN